MKDNKNIKTIDYYLEDAKTTAYKLLDDLDDSLAYHKKEHTTKNVVPFALMIAEKEGFSLEEKLLIVVAAAFHDTGFLKQYNDNEVIGAQFVEEYMGSSQYPYTTEQIKFVKGAIKNTNMKKPPQTKYEKVLRDADLSYIGQPVFLQWKSNLKKESNLHPNSPGYKASLNAKTWCQFNLDFLSSHQWFTDGAKLLYEKGKQQNIAILKKEIQNLPYSEV